MLDFSSLFRNNFDNVNRMILFNMFKTGNPVIDGIVTTILISIVGFITSYIYDKKLDQLIFNICWDDIKRLFCKKYVIIIEGSRSSSVGYNNAYYSSTNYSNRFTAVWKHIIENIDTNKTINQIKEFHSNVDSSSIQPESSLRNGKKDKNLFMVFQKNAFCISKDIYATISISNVEQNNNDSHCKAKTEIIQLCIYSYVYSLEHLKKYIDDITCKHLTFEKGSRFNKLFIYTLCNKCTKPTDIPQTVSQAWTENVFESNRGFHNIFFDGKQAILDKIDFFLNNKEWYNEKGIPYSLGIGLYGPPGTGKTSFSKALAKYTNRHIIVMSLKSIKTKTQLEHFYFESTYNLKNDEGSISFDKKIILFEDIDCIGDIVMSRDKKEKGSSLLLESIDDVNEKKGQTKKDVLDASGNNLDELFDLDTDKIKPVPVDFIPESEKVTLDDILNLWDGIRETPGRILIISSNHYDKLDPALTRPGRIDITQELGFASHTTICEIYHHLFGTEIDKELLKEVKEYFYTPAELVNIYVSHKKEADFLERLLQNRKV